MATKFKDESNSRLYELVKEIHKVMEQEDRGFIFAPMAQPTGNHRTAVFIAGKAEHTEEEFYTCFWTTLASIILNVNTEVPEELREEFKEGFVTFVTMVATYGFPSLNIAKLAKLMEDNDER